MGAEKENGEGNPQLRPNNPTYGTVWYGKSYLLLGGKIIPRIDMFPYILDILPWGIKFSYPASLLDSDLCSRNGKGMESSFRHL